MALVAALIAAAVGGALVGSLLGKDAGEQVKIKQDILNKIDLTAITNVLSTNKNFTSTSTIVGQNVRLRYVNCNVGDIDISQKATISVKIYSGATAKIDQQLIQDVQNEISNQLQQAVKQVDSSLFSMFQKNLKDDQISTINNIFNNTIKANVTVETINSLLTQINDGQSVDIKVDCSNNNAIPTNLKVNQDIQLDLVIVSLVNSVIDQLAKSKQITDIANDVQNKADQEKTDFISKFADLFGKYWFIFVAVIALIALIGLVIFIKLLSGGSQSQPQGQQYVMMQPQYGPSPYGPSPYGPSPYGRAGPIGPSPYGPKPVMYAPRRAF